MNDIIKYPRTQHIRGSRFQHGDDDMEAVSFSDLVGKHLVIEEKMDGANSGISFSDDGELLVQSRGHFLRGGQREKQFDLLKFWTGRHTDMLFDMLSNRYIMYGEWLYAKHTAYYDALPHYFMEFDIYDKETQEFLSEPRRREMIGDHPIVQVKVLHQGVVNTVRNLSNMIVGSWFMTDRRLVSLEEAAAKAGADVSQVLKETDGSTLMEGLYIKAEEDGRVTGRYKFVRESFTSAIMDSETHWHDRPIIANKLAEDSRFFE